MGNIASLLSSWWRGPRKVLILGLDAAGKTTLLYRLKLGQKVPTIPTIGFNVEQVHVGNIQCTVWDIGGQDRLRGLWRHYTHDTHLLIFMIDSHDLDRLDEALQELRTHMNSAECIHCPVLVLANKQDMPTAMSPTDLTKRLFGDSDPEREWRVQGCCALTGEGIPAGMRWVENHL